MNNRQFAILVSITFLVGMIWLGADITFNTKASIPISDKLQTSLESVSPNFNPRVLKIIENEVPEQAPISISQPAPTDAPSPISTLESTKSAQIKP